MSELYPSVLTFLGYRFEVEAVERDGRRLIQYTALDPATPIEVIDALQKQQQNVLCYLKRGLNSPSILTSEQSNA